MDQLFVLLVLFSALLHAAWNAFRHVSEDRVAQLDMMSAPYLVFGAALALALPPAPAWPYIAASALLELGYCFALPLFGVLLALSCGVLAFAVWIGY